MAVAWPGLKTFAGAEAVLALVAEAVEQLATARGVIVMLEGSSKHKYKFCTHEKNLLIKKF